MITRKQQRLLDFMRAFRAEHGVMPSYEEMCDGTGVASKSGINRLVKILEQRGYIKRLPNKARAIELTAKARGHAKSREELQAENDRLREELIKLTAKNHALEARVPRSQRVAA